MSKDSRLYLIFLAIAYLLLFYSCISLFVMKEGEKDRRITLQKRFDDLTVTKSELEMKLKETESANSEIKANIKFQEDKISMLTQRLEEEKAQTARSTAKFQEKEIQIQNLKVRIDEEKTEKAGLIKQLEKINADYLAMKVQLEYMMKSKEEVEKKAKEMAEKEDVSLGTIVITQSTGK